ncbi:DUF4386 domain-containing protein [Gordonia sp. Z-3]|jgi:hypothetical protein|uniref:DUF4386 domain-containing protein n=1 Tax=unclassified Gordonia (in: high G+C Gram-positive bacteria) TaxID=2657482 RepID=UPI000C4538C0|nr:MULTISPECIES: DUF4386 domain-containing protein [unclassified Gordonia (in: high G+C Gram-positive bacteria)]MAU81968.1 hypothetical protein [Gordonia sp. (in: high G+C Gram-positive bacteria)]MED5801774.1 DUF4386 domain-containing protein [Gordonia sp. Z-3]
MTAPSTPRHENSAHSAARWAGLGYLAIFALAMFANFFVLERVFDPADAQATLDGVAANGGLLRWGIIAFAAVFLVDIVVAWALYVLFRPVHRDLSLLAAWARLTYTVFLGVGLVFAVAALLIAENSTEATAADVQLAMRSFEMTWLIGLTAFGVHLIVLARLMSVSAGAPRWLTVALTVAGVAYIVDTGAHILLADYASYADTFLVIVAVPSVVGELGLTVWLLRIAAHRTATPAATSLEAERVSTTVS